MGGGGRSHEESKTIFKDLPGATGDTGYGTSGDVFNQARGMTTAGMQSPFSKSLEETLLNPQFGARTSSEQALLNSLMDTTAARGAVSGLGAPTQSALASAIAPTMVGMRNQDISSMLQGRGQDTQAYQSQLQALLELTGLAMPQTVSGSSTTGSSKQKGWLFF
jgi:hypothetical protein